jgi:type VI secretion system protein ImpA
MPLRDDLLNPIEGENPSGQNMRYSPVFDKIKEARRADDDAPQGDWQRERKTADYKTVVKLAGETLATKTKDLQLAAWLTEALLRTEGFSGFRQGLDLTRGLIEGFWDTLYPEAEDGELDLRAAPVEWVGTTMGDSLRKTAITRGGYSFYQLKESRTVGYEADADNETKLDARTKAVADGKVTAEDFDKDLAATPTAQMEALVAALEGCQESAESLQAVCDEKFGNYSPAFAPLKTAIEEIYYPVNLLLRKRLESEGRVAAPEAEPEPEAPVEYAETGGGSEGAAPAPRKRATAGLDPVDLDDVAARLAAVGRYLRQQDPYSPGPYLLLRGYRWGELRGNQDQTTLLPPSTEIRQSVKRLSLEANWAELLETAESAMAQPCGRAWLDLQRYVVRAAEESGYAAIAQAVRSELRALLADLPALPSWTLMDDTPTANAETQAWLKQIAEPPALASADSAPVFEEPSPASAVPAGEPVPPDTFTLALEAARSGRAADAIQMLADEIPRQQSGRARFQRKLQLAQVCMMTNHEELARPILEELALSIDSHNLEDWESADIVAHPLAMLHRCLAKGGADDDLRRKLYARISRLDPVRALESAR